MKKRTLKYIIFGFIFFPEIIFSQTVIPKESRENFTETIKDLCHTATPEAFALDNKFEDVQVMYQNRMRCLFNDAFLNSINYTNQQRTQEYEKILPEIEKRFPSVQYQETDCREVTLDFFQAGQKDNGFKSACNDDGYLKTIRLPSSPCRVGETVFNEYCAYQLYMWGKSRDEISLFNESEKKDLQNVLTQGTRFSGTRKKLDDERQKSKQALIETLMFYEAYEQNYRLYTLLVILRMELEELRVRLDHFRLALESIPGKYIDHAQKTEG